MADIASWVVGAEPACPWPRGSFLAALDEQRREADEFVIEASPVGKAIQDRIERDGELEGTATQLLQMFSSGVAEESLKDPDWPKKPQTFGTKLRELAPNLRRQGIDVQFPRTGKRRTIVIRKNNRPPDMPSSPSLPSPADSNPASGAVVGGPPDADGDGTSPDSDGDSHSGDGADGDGTAVNGPEVAR
jgi:hypothetical protein